MTERPSESTDDCMDLATLFNALDIPRTDAPICITMAGRAFFVSSLGARLTDTFSSVAAILARLFLIAVAALLTR